MPIRFTLLSRTAVCLLVSGLLLTQTGCLGLMSNLMHAMGADQIPAECELLEDSKVAVVTFTDRSQYSEDIAARLLSRKVSDILLRKIDDISLVREDEIQEYRDTHGWENSDFLDIGQGVEAEKVLAIELSGMKLREGATLYRGTAAVTLTLLDVETESVVFRKEIDEFTFPSTAGQYTSETTESKFRKLYLQMLAERIGRVFHPYDFAETVALDGAIASQ
ncbi:hypothetical protein LOC71_19345 [Rhodopirellula sp. JC740]|uniref:Uncharacterized protein n=1 Tax=Rhodopirellula halodulae TaxID=2894198 RepID=A0ABS8NLJ4_9BACT|nr:MULTISPECIES: hypothetical protein [unclassified Rhodopirellula]MCC9644433.1 hypothetical protein [Rhodopirellula sp. JC740]MCC9654885.1 hypothetical protein [Rhodopirellula sp. JC737]